MSAKHTAQTEGHRKIAKASTAKRKRVHKAGAKQVRYK